MLHHDETTLVHGRSRALAQLFGGRRLWLTPAVLLAAALMVRLGFWQLSRRAERLERNATITRGLAQSPLILTGAPDESMSAEYRPVIVSGTFDPAHEIILRNRAWKGAPGVHLVTPLRIAGSDRAVLVDRGWIPFEEQEQDERARYRAPTGTVEVHGRLRQPQVRRGWMTPADPPLSADMPRLDAWFRVDVARIQEQTPYSLLPLYVEQSPEGGETGPPWRENAPVLTEGSHLSYAIQWFAFATILLVGYGVRAAR